MTVNAAASTVGSQAGFDPFVYVSCATAKEIHVFKLERARRRLRPVAVYPVPGTDDPGPASLPMAVSPDGDRLYAALRSEPYPVSAFSIDRVTGALQHIGTVAQPGAMAYLTVTRDAKSLLGASYKHAKLTVTALDERGVPQTPLTQVIETPPKAHCVLEAPNGLIYATTVDGEAILAWQRDAHTGLLRETDPATTPLPHGSGPRHLAFHPTLPVLYCINEEAGSLSTLDLSPASPVPVLRHTVSLMPADFHGRAMAADLHVSSDGRHVYASVRMTNTMTVFAVDPRDGSLTRTSQFEPEPVARGFRLDVTGRFLISAGQKSDTVGLYALDSDTGAATFLERHAVSANANWVEIVPSRSV